jgi:hypothetical protein
MKSRAPRKKRGLKPKQRGNTMPIRSLFRSKKIESVAKKGENGKDRASAEPALEARIDFPKEGEKILSGHYAVRVSAKPGLDVEISTGGDVWWACRESVGFFWFDWWPTKAGRTTLSVRVKSGKGRWKKAADRACSVAPRNTN